MARENGQGPGGPAPKWVSPDGGSYIGAPGWAAGMPLRSEATTGVPLPADVTDAEPPPRRRRLVPLTAAVVTVVAAVAVTAIVLGKTSAHKPVATRAPTHAAARTPVGRDLTIDQLRTGDCLQGPPAVNTARLWPDIATAVPCSAIHIAEVYFFSDNYWPRSMAFPGHAKMAHLARAKCRKAFSAYNGVPPAGSVYNFRYISPWTRALWDSGGRLLLCTAYVWTNQFPSGEPLYGSMKGIGG
jgi:hypothetical protein